MFASAMSRAATFSRKCAGFAVPGIATIDGDAAPAFSLQVRKGMTANFLDIKRPFS